MGFEGMRIIAIKDFEIPDFTLDEGHTSYKIPQGTKGIIIRMEDTGEIYGSKDKDIIFTVQWDILPQYLFSTKFPSDDFRLYHHLEEFVTKFSERWK